ncbi:hypothetical protein FJZ39_01835 [Candidatus Saccharibacteria bacterium]|nr:hypothetical protein [Candidatus Saccharibacteria bacterium]
MTYEFSIGWFAIGIIIMIAGALMVRFHPWLAENFGVGVGDYDKYKLAGLIAVGIGFVVMVNLHTTLLRALLGAVFPGI